VEGNVTATREPPAPTDRDARRLVVGAAVIAVALLAIAGLVLTPRACKEPSTIGTPGNPLRLLLSPDHATAELGPRLAAALAVRSGLTIEVTVPAGEAEALNAAPLADVGLLPVFAYLLVHQEYRVEAGLQVLRGDGARSFAGVLLVGGDDPADGLAALAGRPVAYVGSTSTTGFLLAARTLADAGVRVEPVFVGSHAAALEALRAGRVAAAATYDDGDRTGVRVLARTGEVPNEPIFFSRRVPAPTRTRLAAALAELAATPDGAALLADLGGITGFAPVTDRDYAPVRELLAATQRTLLDVVPQARPMIERHRLAPGLAAP
jgi:phosphonate transport system substrate-binding protein